jgi:choline dehydrogenase-like flavoprotein
MRIETDVCIFGAGAAGITLARALRGSGLSVCLVEGGGFAPSADSQDLYRGEMVTQYRKDQETDYLIYSRLRYFGGSTNHWVGWCRPLDPEDFLPHDFLPDSGWPFGRAELEPFYREAAALCEITPFDEQEGNLEGEMPLGEPIRTRLFHFSPPTRFGERYRQDLEQAPDIRLMLDTQLLSLRADVPSGRVTHAELLAPEGKVELAGRAFVLACGGIENARVLLLSDQDQPGGLGNRHDLVGRYFTEHINSLEVGRVLFSQSVQGKGQEPFHLYRAPSLDPARGHRVRGMFSIDPAYRAKRRWANVLVHHVFDPWRLTEFESGLASVSASMTRHAGLSAAADAPRAELVVIAEQRPNRDSRVTLSEQRDRLGLRQARLDWKLQDEDARTVREVLELVADRLGMAHMGRVQVRLDEEAPWSTTRGGCHHMGTTRMHTDPSRGVVDADCRVHGLHNLWLAGSSVFPTGGAANPTLTLVALALRLARRLQQELRP